MTRDAGCHFFPTSASQPILYHHRPPWEIQPSFNIVPLLWLQPLSYRVFAHFWIGLIADLDGQLLTPRRRPGVQKGYRGNLPREKIRTMANKLDKVTCDRFSVRLSLFIFSFFKIQSWAEAKKEVTDGNGLVAGAHITEYVERKGKRSRILL